MNGQTLRRHEGVRTAVLGARGYAGLELLRLLFRHPCARPVAYGARESFQIQEILPAAPRELEFVNFDRVDRLKDLVECVFLATPVEASLELAPRLLALGLDVVDLSGAFRLQAGGTAADRAENFRRWYGIEHREPELLESAQYGLIPWAGPVRDHKSPVLVANPGCYATAVLMALIPLLREGWIDPKSIVIDAKSGTSGAGRRASESLLFNEVDGQCTPYRVGEHQHIPEIRQWARQYSGVEIDPWMTTHLIPVRRGISAGIYARIGDKGLGLSVTDKEALIARAFSDAYGHYSLAKISRFMDGHSGVSLRSVVGTSRTSISFRVVEDKLYLFSLIDNLLKGAAGQAIENFNRLMDFPSALGLEELEGVL